jgi:hypothetical protein
VRVRITDDTPFSIPVGKITGHIATAESAHGNDYAHGRSPPDKCSQAPSDEASIENPPVLPVMTAPAQPYASAGNHDSLREKRRVLFDLVRLPSLQGS